MTKTDLRTDPSEEEENKGVDEAIPMHIIKERTKKAFKETMIQDI